MYIIIITNKNIVLFLVFLVFFYVLQELEKEAFQLIGLYKGMIKIAESIARRDN